MSLNWCEIDAVLETLNVQGAWIQHSFQSSYHHLILSIAHTTSTYTIMICTAPHATRIHHTSRRHKKMHPKQRFEQLLHSRIKNSHIISVTQSNHNRIIHFHLKKDDEHLHIFIRLWNNAANIFLCDDTMHIIDCLWRRPKKQEVTGSLFSLPQPISSSLLNNYHIRPEWHNHPALHEAIDTFYAEYEYNIQRTYYVTALTQLFQKQITYISSRMQSLRINLQKTTDAHRMQEIGSLIVAQAHAIPPHVDEITLIDYYTSDNATITVSLNPQLSALDNAQYYFNNAKKNQTAQTFSQQEYHHLQKKQNTLITEQQQLAHISSIKKLSQLYEAYTETNYITQKQTHSTVGILAHSAQYVIIVGRTSQENDHLLRHVIKGNDIWLHVRDYKGSYVFIKTKKGKNTPLDVLLDAANLAIWYSKAKHHAEAELYYTEVKYLRRPKKGKQGLVLPMRNKHLRVRIENERINRLLYKELS